jgi:hypothetical protein
VAVFKIRSVVIKTIPNTLTALQSEVKGPIEVFEEKKGVVFLCNEEGHIRHMPPNPYFCGIVGPVVAVSSEGEEFCSLDDAQIEWIKERIIRE